MNDNGPRSPDALFWFGNDRGTTLLNFTTGKAIAIITEHKGDYSVEFRLPLWRRLLLQTAGNYSCPYPNMRQAVAHADLLLEKCAAIPKRTFWSERYYFVLDTLLGSSQPEL